MREYAQALANEVVLQQENHIKAAITFAIGDGWLIGDISGRGEMVKYPDGREVFVFDGKPMLEFGPIEFRQERQGQSFKLVACRNVRQLYA